MSLQNTVNQTPEPQTPTSLDKSGTSVRAMFSDIAGRYDFLNHLLSANRDRRWRRRAIKLLNPKPRHRVLDLCCGTGDFAIECALQQSQCEIIGADFAQPMLQIATVKSALPFAAADALRLPFRDEAFDAVIDAFGVRNFENTRAGLEEMARVVKPAGRVLVLEFMRPTSPILKFGFGFFFKRVLPIVGKLISRHCAAYNYLPSSVDEFYTRREFENLMRETGLKDVRSWDLDGGIATIFLARKCPEIQ